MPEQPEEAAPLGREFLVLHPGGVAPARLRPAGESSSSPWKRAGGFYEEPIERVRLGTARGWGSSGNTPSRPEAGALFRRTDDMLAATCNSGNCKA